MKRVVSLLLTCMMTVGVFTGCGKADTSENVVNISILNSKPEIESSLNDLINNFTKENKDINVKIVKYDQSGSYKDKLDSMYASDNAPTMSLIDTSNISTYKDSCLDLSSEEWVKDVSGGVSEIAKSKEGKVLAFPFSVEGMGFVYNKKVLDAAGVKPESIKTISDLEEAFKKVETSGKKGLIITNEEWSLGDHFMSTYYSIQQKESGKSTSEYFESLKNVDLKSDAVLNNLLNTFDVMKKYNMYAENPLLPSYNKCAEILGTGEVGFWYMGNWASQEILTNSNGNKDFGFIPVPVSDNASDYGNSELVAGVTKYIIVDGKDSSEEQQEAAKRFLNYIVYNEAGHNFLVKEANAIPSFSNITTTSEDKLNSDIITYRDAGKTMELMNNYLPGNNSKVVGAAVKKYLNNEISRDDLINTIQSFWIEN